MGAAEAKKNTNKVSITGREKLIVRVPKHHQAVQA